MTPLHGHTKSSSPVFSSCVQISVAGIKIRTIWPRLFLTMLHQIEDFLMSLYLERDLLLKEGLHYRQVVITTSKNESSVSCLVLIHSGLIWLSRKLVSLSNNTWRLTKAPAARYLFTNSCLPLEAATIRGVRPSWFAMWRLPVLFLVRVEMMMLVIVMAMITSGGQIWCLDGLARWPRPRRSAGTFQGRRGQLRALTRSPPP